MRDPANDWDQEVPGDVKCDNTFVARIFTSQMETWMTELLMTAAVLIGDDKAFVSAGGMERLNHPNREPADIGNAMSMWEDKVRRILDMEPSDRNYRHRSQMGPWAALTYMVDAVKTRQYIQGDTDCPFEGRVTGTLYGNGREPSEFHWSCPTCGKDHVEDAHTVLDDGY